MLEDRIDPRLQADEPGEPPSGLADRWKMNRREREAAVFDDVADQIEEGLLRVSGVDPADVVERLRTRAEKTRDGKDRMRRRRSIVGP